jgi:hypothetical protein
MGMSKQYISEVIMFFGNAYDVVDLNGRPMEQFRIERGVMQGCPLVPYLF